MRLRDAVGTRDQMAIKWASSLNPVSCWLSDSGTDVSSCEALAHLLLYVIPDDSAETRMQRPKSKRAYLQTHGSRLARTHYREKARMIASAATASSLSTRRFSSMLPTASATQSAVTWTPSAAQA